MGLSLVAPAPSSISGLLLLLLLLLPLLLLLLLLLLLFGVILAPPPNEPPRDITVEGDGGLPPPQDEVPVDAVVPGSPPAAAPTIQQFEVVDLHPYHFEIFIAV